MRTPEGRAIYGFVGNNRKLFLILGIVNLLWIALRVFAIDGQVPLLAILLLILATVGFIFMGKGEREAQPQFDSDTDYRTQR